MLPWCDLRVDTLVARACRQTGLADFGDTPFRAGLESFVAACEAEAELSLFGQFGLRWDTVRFLSNLLRFREEEKRAPAILTQPVERPIFIAGLPRSGTTYLHKLLAADPANRVPRVWQLIYPYPIDGRAADRRRALVARQLRMFRLLAPKFHGMHPITADSPQECSEINAHVFASLRFDTTYHVPAYRRWLDRAGHLDAYRFHRRFLQHLQHQDGGGGRWVLKCPDHIFALDAIRAVYPDARLVLVHRDPLKVLPSLAGLTEVLRRPFSRRIDRGELGRQEADRWLWAAELMIDAANRDTFVDPILHISFPDLVGDPLGTVRRLYRHFGLELGPEVEERITLAETDTAGGYGGNRHSLETYGLDRAEEGRRFGRYVEHFGIRPEVARSSRPVGAGTLPAPSPASRSARIGARG